MRASSWIVAGITCALLGVAGWWVWSASAPEVPRVVAEPAMPRVVLPEPDDAEARRQARRERRMAARQERREALRAQRQARREAKAAKVAKEPRLPPEERAQARSETRSAALDDMMVRLDEHARSAGWSAGVTDEVAELLTEGHEEVSLLLEGVDRGEFEWEDVRRDVREIRFEQAARVEDVLGEEGFRDFSEGMGFERFQGEEWVRGRVP